MSTAIIREMVPGLCSAILEMGHRPVPDRYREVFPCQLKEMRGWLADCDLEPIDPTSDLWVYKYVEAWYDGGIVEFLINVPRAE